MGQGAGDLGGGRRGQEVSSVLQVVSECCSSEGSSHQASVHLEDSIQVREQSGESSKRRQDGS